MKAGLANEKQLQKAHKKNQSKKTGKPKQRDNLAAAYHARENAERKERQEKARLAALKKANDELLAEFEAKGGLTAEIIKSQRDYLRKVREWTEISDRA